VGLREALGARAVFHPEEAVVWQLLVEEHTVAGRAGQAMLCAVCAGQAVAGFAQVPVARA
jgi:hypothetical protein